MGPENRADAPGARLRFLFVNRPDLGARDTGSFIGTRFEHVAHASAVGGASSSAADMGRYMRMLLGRGQLEFDLGRLRFFHHRRPFWIPIRTSKESLIGLGRICPAAGFAKNSRQLQARFGMRGILVYTWRKSMLKGIQARVNR